MYLLRSSALALFALGLCSLTASAQPVGREQFIRAYVLCNNMAWQGTSHELIPFIRDNKGGLNSGTRSPAVLGFIELGYLWGRRELTKPHEAATLGWAAAMKAYADDGGIEARFRMPGPAHSYLRGTVRNTDRLKDQEVESLATNFHLARRARRMDYWVLNGLVARSVVAPLDIATASRLLHEIGSHESVGPAMTAPPVMRPCADALKFLKHPDGKS